MSGINPSLTSLFSTPPEAELPEPTDPFLPSEHSNLPRAAASPAPTAFDHRPSPAGFASDIIEKIATKRAETVKLKKAMDGFDISKGLIRELKNLNCEYRTKKAELDKLGEKKNRLSDELTQALIRQGIANASHISARLVEAEEVMDELNLDIKGLEIQADIDEVLDRQPARSLTKLAEDVKTSKFWMVDQRPNMIAREQQECLRVTQQNILEGKPGFPPSHQYANVASYFMYSAPRGCAIMIERKPGLPIRWEFKYRYESSRIEEVQAIFSSCRWEPRPEIVHPLPPLVPAKKA